MVSPTAEIQSPLLLSPLYVPSLISAILASWHRSVTVGILLVTVSPETSETSVALKSTPWTVAVLVTKPASISDWVIE